MMTDDGAGLLHSGWEWIVQDTFAVSGSLTFVYGASPEEIIKAYGLDPSDGQLLTAAQAGRALQPVVYGEKFDVLNPWMRAGRAGEWAFGIDDSSVILAEDAAGAARELARGTEAVLLAWTPVADYFSYCAYGIEVTSFEPQSAGRRHGSHPDLFLREMRAVGLDLAPDCVVESGEFANVRLRLLQMLTAALGIELRREVVQGRLLTVQRGGMLAPG